jgi:hypothetical protein
MNERYTTNDLKAINPFYIGFNHLFNIRVHGTDSTHAQLAPYIAEYVWIFVNSHETTHYTVNIMYICAKTL